MIIIFHWCQPSGFSGDKKFSCHFYWFLTRIMSHWQRCQIRFSLVELLGPFSKEIFEAALYSLSGLGVIGPKMPTRRQNRFCETKWWHGGGKHRSTGHGQLANPKGDSKTLRLNTQGDEAQVVQSNTGEAHEVIRRGGTQKDKTGASEWSRTENHDRIWAPTIKNPHTSQERHIFTESTKPKLWHTR